MSNLPNNLPQILRSYGLKVVEVPGWKTRGRPASTGTFAPAGVLCHHTATSVRSSLTSVLNLLVRGRSDLPGPLCQLSLGRDGTVYVVAAGRANHAGKAKPAGTMSGGDGNSLYIGIEAQNDGVGEKWPTVQYEAYVLLAAVLSVRITHNSANTVLGHKETSYDGKVDPTFNMSQFRNKVAVKMAEINNPPSQSAHATVTTSRGVHVDHAIADLKAATGKGDRAKRIQAALAALNLIKPAQRTVSH